MTAGPPRFEARNRTAIAGWAFIGLWLGFLLLMTGVIARDGPHPSQPADLQYGAIALFWLIGIPVAGHLLSQPCTRLVVAADGSASMVRRSAFGREVEAFPAGAIAAIDIRRGKDDDGDLLFRTLIVAADGRERLIGEGPVEADQQARAAQLRAALGLPGSLLAESAPPA
ncbi:hypothetical protein KPL78_04020 [Roseomonas sp. HJA6]|uniref:PH domain-containing protein n=1 Tax=Roseomonas alba TaxID=2846776 RepID=A0ABS7A3X6_9PROT|nr:hypothetical protein [Neoroseomonas alba]